MQFNFTDNEKGLNSPVVLIGVAFPVADYIKVVT